MIVLLVALVAALAVVILPAARTPLLVFVEVCVLAVAVVALVR